MIFLYIPKLDILSNFMSSWFIACKCVYSLYLSFILLTMLSGLVLTWLSILSLIPINTNIIDTNKQYVGIMSTWLQSYNFGKINTYIKNIVCYNNSWNIVAVSSELNNPIVWIYKDTVKNHHYVRFRWYFKSKNIWWNTYVKVLWEYAYRKQYWSLVLWRSPYTIDYNIHSTLPYSLKNCIFTKK